MKIEIIILPFRRDEKLENFGYVSMNGHYFQDYFPAANPGLEELLKQTEGHPRILQNKGEIEYFEIQVR